MTIIGNLIHALVWACIASVSTLFAMGLPVALVSIIINLLEQFYD